MRAILLLLFYFLLLAATTIAQRSLTFNHLTKSDRIGLLSDIVYTTCQDERGFIWVGTANGLQRFDGSKFIHFSSSVPKNGELPLTAVTEVINWKKDYLWLLLPSEKKVGLFNKQNFSFKAVPIKTKLSLTEKNYEMRLHKDAAGNVFLFIWKYGIFHYDSVKNVFSDDNFFQLPARWNPTNYFYEDKVAGQMWLACPDSGLAVYDYRKRSLYTANNNPQQIPLLKNQQIQKGVSELFIDSYRRHWIFYWRPHHMYSCFDEKGLPLKDTSGISANPEYGELRYFFESSNKTVWMYGSNCLYSMEKGADRIHFYPQRGEEFSSIIYQNIYHIMEDRDGLLWISTDNGLYYTSSSTETMDVSNLYIRKNKTPIEITDLIELKSGQYWLSTWGDGIITFTNRFVKYDAGIYKAQPAMDRVSQIQYRQAWSLLQDRNGKIWIGCQGGKYMLYDTVAHHTEFKTLKEAEGATIRYIAQDKHSNIWLGTQRGHIIRYNGTYFSTVLQLNVIVLKILIDAEGLIWIATEGRGVFCINENGKLLHHYSIGDKQNALFANNVTDLEQLNDSTIICAAGALNFINKKTKEIRWVTFEDGLPGNSVVRIRKDVKGYLWINTLDGLCRYNPFNKTITLYSSKDGIEFDRYTTKADYLCSEGYIMFAGSSHLLFFKPSIFENSQKPSNVTITDFKLFNKFLKVDSLLSATTVFLNSNENSFTIDFSSLSFLQREKLVYYYRMKGINDEWIKAERIGTVNYTLLPPGKYVFEVYSENIDGVRSQDITSMHIKIRPPFWRTGWFLSTLLTIIALIAYAMHRLRIKRILAVEKIRNRVARDLHDDMGSTLSTINILSSMAKAKLNTDTAKTGEYINKISDNSQRMMEAMDDIVWAIKPANDSMQKVIARMREFSTSVFEAKDIELEFKADEAVNEARINMEARRDFFLIFKEAVNNAAKYSKCSNAVVQVLVDGSKLILMVTDNGTGFDVKSADGGNGLGNMQKRADALKAKLAITSSLGQGTNIQLTVPLN